MRKLGLVRGCLWGLPWLVARPGVRRWSAWLSLFLNSSALLDTELPGPQVVTLPLGVGVRPEQGRSGMDRQMEWSSFQSGRSNKLSSERIIMPLITIHCKFNFICNNNQEPNTSL